MKINKTNLPYIFDLIEKGNEERPGKLIAINDNEINFPIKRIFYLYDFNEDKNLNKRGNHAHKTTSQILIMGKGTVNIHTININSNEEMSFSLIKPNQALYLPPNNFIELINFSQDSFMIVLCDETYENDILIKLEDLNKK